MQLLLVEEEALIAMDIEQLCHEHGAKVVATISSEAKLTSDAIDEVLLKHERRPLDAAILDVKVGEGFTSELARRLAERKIPFVFATGYSDAEPFFAEFPDVPVVTKPYVGRELIETLAAAIHRACSGHGCRVGDLG